MSISKFCFVKLLAGYQIRMRTNNETKFKRVGVFVEVVLARRVAIKMLPLNLKMN